MFPSGEQQESVNQFEHLGRWLHRQSAGSLAERVEGSSFVWCHTAWPFGNQAVLTQSVRNEEDLARQAEAVMRFAAGRRETFLWMLCHHLVPADMAPCLNDVLSKHGLHPALTTMGMVAPEGLAPSVRPAPACNVRRARTQADLVDLARINAAAYLVPAEWAPDLVEKISLSADDCFPFLAEVDGQPVASAATFVLDTRLYVAFVATLPPFLRRGYAEAAMRASIGAATAQTGIRRVVLHATEAGHPVYRRMGFQDVIPCSMFAGHPSPLVP